LDLKRSLIGTAVIAALVLGALALFGTKSLDVADLESDLAAQVAPPLRASEDAVDVACPDDVDVEAGFTFDCEVTYDGSSVGSPARAGTATIQVELTDDDGGYKAQLE
jgi:Domain of unknown function (DUF4333)